MKEKTGIERRTLLRAITAASGTALSSAFPPRNVAAQPASRARPIRVTSRRRKSRPATTPFS